ncbi:MAG: hypothetical protein HY744_05950 [Deltaproteobacteria bacterium]|nr:hypothetical protein [Deltaproteobacteria bacterium]
MSTAADIGQKVARLIGEFFPWGERDYPPRPGPATPELLAGAVRRWLEEQTRLFRHAALALLARVEPVLREAEQALPADERPRLFARIDLSALVKSPDGILDKMVRDWSPETGAAPGLNFRNFKSELGDLGRFRIVTNFLSDADEIAKVLAAPFQAPAAQPLTAAQIALRDDFLIGKEGFKDAIRLMPGARPTGERSFKGVFFPRQAGSKDLKVEVQVQTMLQEAWDKKDHFLVYEPRRRGQEPDPQHVREMFAMSELLYVADLTFERLREAVLARRRS